MLIDHETQRDRDEHDVPHEGEPSRDDTQMQFPVLEEPRYLDEDLEDEMEAPPDSPLRGIWIGVAAAAVTFVLVFAIPHWLGWYDIGPPPQVKRDAAPESVIATVTAQPSGSAVVETGSPAVSAAAAPPATAPPANPPAPAAPPADPPAPAARRADPPPAAAARETRPAAPKVTPTVGRGEPPFWVQVAAFKNAGQAGRLAAKVKRDGFPAEVRRLRGGSVPWVVWVGTYPTREQAEATRDALARKGLRGFIR
jgi:cell division protein FtsN